MTRSTNSFFPCCVLKFAPNLLIKAFIFHRNLRASYPTRSGAGAPSVRELKQIAAELVKAREGLAARIVTEREETAEGRP